MGPGRVTRRHVRVGATAVGDVGDGASGLMSWWVTLASYPRQCIVRSARLMLCFAELKLLSTSPLHSHRRIQCFMVLLLQSEDIFTNRTYNFELSPSRIRKTLYRKGNCHMIYVTSCQRHVRLALTMQSCSIQHPTDPLSPRSIDRLCTDVASGVPLLGRVVSREVTPLGSNGVDLVFSPRSSSGTTD